jgi:hypothetical protein
VIKSEVNKNIVGLATVFLTAQHYIFAKNVGLTIELLAQPSYSLLYF